MSDEKATPEEIALWEHVRRAIVELDGEEAVDPVKVANIVITRISHQEMRFDAIMHIRQCGSRSFAAPS